MQNAWSCVWVLDARAPACSPQPEGPGPCPLERRAIVRVPAAACVTQRKGTVAKAPKTPMAGRRGGGAGRMAGGAFGARARGSPPLSRMEKGRRCYRASARAFACTGCKRVCLAAERSLNWTRTCRCVRSMQGWPPAWSRLCICARPPDRRLAAPLPCARRAVLARARPCVSCERVGVQHAARRPYQEQDVAVIARTRPCVTSARVRRRQVGFIAHAPLAW